MQKFETMGVTLPILIRKIETMADGGVKVTVVTNELSPKDGADLFALNGKFGYAYISPQLVSRDEIEKVDKLDPDLPGRSQSERIRNSLFVLFTQDAEGFANFDDYYHAKTEKIIQHLKSKIK